jgi:hypothetical protein
VPTDHGWWPSIFLRCLLSAVTFTLGHVRRSPWTLLYGLFAIATVAVAAFLFDRASLPAARAWIAGLWLLAASLPWTVRSIWHRQRPSPRTSDDQGLCLRMLDSRPGTITWEFTAAPGGPDYVVTLHTDGPGNFTEKAVAFWINERSADLRPIAAAGRDVGVAAADTVARCHFLSLSSPEETVHPWLVEVLRACSQDHEHGLSRQALTLCLQGRQWAICVPAGSTEIVTVPVSGTTSHRPHRLRILYAPLVWGADGVPVSPAVWTQAPESLVLTPVGDVPDAS